MKLHDSRIQDKSKRIFDINDPYDPFKSNNDLGLVLSAIKMIPRFDFPLTAIEYIVRKGNQQQEERMRVSHYDSEKNIITIDHSKEKNLFQWPEKNTFSSKQEFKNSLEFFNQIEYFKTQSAKELKEIDSNFTKELKNIFQPKNNGEAPAALGPSAKNQKQKVRRVKVRKPPKPKTTADEYYGDGFLNQVYNTAC